MLHAHALLLGEVVGMVLEWMVKQQFNFFAQPECEMSSPFLVTLSNWRTQEKKKDRLNFVLLVVSKLTLIKSTNDLDQNITSHALLLTNKNHKVTWKKVHHTVYENHLKCRIYNIASEAKIVTIKRGKLRFL